MKNVYDIRKAENLLFILPVNKRNRINRLGKAELAYYTPNSDFIDKKFESVAYNQCAIFVNLYYTDTVKQCMNYLNRIPNDIHIYVYSSNKDVLIKAKNLRTRPNILYHLKENRGRDISALLISARETLFQYEYICFLHDKKANADYLKDDVDIWIDNLWGDRKSVV